MSHWLHRLLRPGTRGCNIWRNPLGTSARLDVMTRSPFLSLNRILIVALVFAITGGQCFGLTRTRKRRVHTALQAAVIPASTTTTATIAPPAHRMALQPAKPAGVSEPVIA